MSWEFQPTRFKRPAKSMTVAGCFIFSRNTLEQGRLRLFSFQSLLRERDGVWKPERRRKTCFLPVCLYCRGHKSTAFRVWYGWGFKTVANSLNIFTLESHRFHAWEPPRNLQAWEHRVHYMWIWVQLPKPWIGRKIFLLEATAWGLYRVFQPFVNVGHGINSIWALSEAFARMCGNAQIRFYAVKADMTNGWKTPW